jgi:hypothetical protein
MVGRGTPEPKIKWKNQMNVQIGATDPRTENLEVSEDMDGLAMRNPGRKIKVGSNGSPGGSVAFDLSCHVF